MEAQPTIPVVPPPVVEPQPSQSKKIPKIILLVFLFIILAVTLVLFGFQLTQQEFQDDMIVLPVEPSPTLSPLVTDASTYEITDSSNITGWKTFHANTTKYSVDYPSDWFTNPGNPNQFYNYDQTTVPVRGFSPDVTDKIKIEISTSQTPYTGSVGEFLIENHVDDKTFSEFLLGDQQAIKNNVTEDGLAIGIYVKNPVTSHIHTIVAYRHDLNEELVDQILSSFRFLEETSGKLQVCPEIWANQLSLPQSAYLRSILGSTPENFPQQYLIIEGETKKIGNYDIEWIRENCEVNEPEPVG